MNHFHSKNILNKVRSITNYYIFVIYIIVRYITIVRVVSDHFTLHLGLLLRKLKNNLFKVPTRIHFLSFSITLRLKTSSAKKSILS